MGISNNGENVKYIGMLSRINDNIDMDEIEKMPGNSGEVFAFSGVGVSGEEPAKLKLIKSYCKEHDAERIFTKMTWSPIIEDRLYGLFGLKMLLNSGKISNESFFNGLDSFDECRTLSVNRMYGCACVVDSVSHTIDDILDYEKMT
jgi:hypothetical protein